MVTKRETYVDIEAEWRSGNLKLGEPGGCYGNFDSEVDECKTCYENDQCAARTFDSFNAEIQKIARIAAAPPPEKLRKLLRLPTTFKAFEAQITELPYVARFSRVNSISYVYQRKKMLEVIRPVSDESIMVMLHNCKKRDFVDDRKPPALWDKDPKYPKKPFIFIRAEDWEYELDIIKQLHTKLHRGKVIFDEAKYVNRRRELRKKDKKTVRSAGANTGGKKKARTKARKRTKDNS